MKHKLIGIYSSDTVFRQQLGKYTFASNESFAEGAVIHLPASTARTSWLKNGKFSHILLANDQSPLRTFAKLSVNHRTVNGSHHTIADFGRMARDRKTAHYLGADSNDLMNINKFSNFCAKVIASIVFAVFAQQAGTHKDVHLLS